MTLSLVNIFLMMVNIWKNKIHVPTHQPDISLYQSGLTGVKHVSGTTLMNMGCCNQLTHGL
jgi:hypothetical protein